MPPLLVARRPRPALIRDLDSYRTTEDRLRAVPWYLTEPRRPRERGRSLLALLPRRRERLRCADCTAALTR